MGCLSRIVVIVAILVQIIAGALALIVLGSAGVLGSAAVVNSNDALIVFCAIIASLIATIVLAPSCGNHNEHLDSIASVSFRSRQRSPAS